MDEIERALRLNMMGNKKTRSVLSFYDHLNSDLKNLDNRMNRNLRVLDNLKSGNILGALGASGTNLGRAANALQALQKGGLGGAIKNYLGIGDKVELATDKPWKFDMHIVNLLTKTSTSFKLTPEEISDNINANFNDQDIPGRSAPIPGYSSTGPRSISFTIKLHDDYCEGGLIKTIRQLKALAYPNYTEYVTPPSCYLRVGDLIQMTAICKEVGVSWQKPIRQGIYIVADIVTGKQIGRAHV